MFASFLSLSFSYCIMLLRRAMPVFAQNTTTSFNKITSSPNHFQQQQQKITVLKKTISKCKKSSTHPIRVVLWPICPDTDAILAVTGRC